jgi:hypothetical protein
MVANIKPQKCFLVFVLFLFLFVVCFPSFSVSFYQTQTPVGGVYSGSARPFPSHQSAYAAVHQSIPSFTCVGEQITSCVLCFSSVFFSFMLFFFASFFVFICPVTTHGYICYMLCYCFKSKDYSSYHVFLLPTMLLCLSCLVCNWYTRDPSLYKSVYLSTPKKTLK